MSRVLSCLMLHQFFIEIQFALNSSVTALMVSLWQLELTAGIGYELRVPEAAEQRSTHTLAASRQMEKSTNPISLR